MLENNLKIKTVNTSIVILLNCRNEVLLSKKDMTYNWFPGAWCLFGGGIEEGETPEVTIRREINEELGISLENITLFDTRPYSDKPINGEMRKGKLWIYISHLNEKIENLRIKEGAGFAYFSSTELNNVPIVDYNLEILKDYFKMNKT